MGYPPDANILPFASNALDTRRIRHHVHKPVSLTTSNAPLPFHAESLMISIYAGACMHARILSAFFRKGQVIETFRGEGVYQPAVDLAIEKLRAGAWVRAFMFLFFLSCFVIIVFRFLPHPTTHPR